MALATLVLRAQELEEVGDTYKLARRPGRAVVRRLIEKGLLKELPSGALAPTALLRAIYAVTIRPSEGEELGQPA